MAESRFIPLRRQALLTALDGDDAMRHVAKRLHHVLRFEADGQRERLLASYAPFDPDPLTSGNAQGSKEQFLAAFDDVALEANFERVQPTELAHAFSARSLFPLQVKVDLDAYDVLALYKRGMTTRIEKVRGATTLWRWKSRELHLYDRLIVVLRLKPDALETSKAARVQEMAPGKIYLKLFKNIPQADLEMVLPNTRLTMRPLDRLMIYGPLVAGVLWTLYSSVGLLIALAQGTLVQAIQEGTLQAMGGVLLVLFGYLWKTHGKVKTRRLEYMRTLSRGLYFRNLANNGAVLEQLLGFAQNEEEKEALLAYALLQREPLRATALDRRAESWIRAQTGLAADFDVQGGIGRLHRLGLVNRRRGKWHVLPPHEAARLLDARWDAAL